MNSTWDVDRMTGYRYRALDKDGCLRRGKLKAASEQEAVRQLRDKALFPLKVSKDGKVGGARFSPLAGETLFEDLAGLVRAGATLDKALELIGKQRDNGDLSSVARELSEEVRRGKSLSAALRQREDMFPPMAVSMVTAGETSGRLADSLADVAAALAWRREFKREIVSALAYPLILLVLSLVSVLVMLVHILPQFAQVFIDMQREVPSAMAVLLDAGNWLGEWGWSLPVALALLWWGARRFSGLRFFKRAAGSCLLKCPILGGLLLKAELGRYFGMFGQLAASGVPLLSAAAMAGETITNQRIQERLAGLTEAIRAGRSVSSYFQGRAGFSQRIPSLLVFSEEKGALPEGLIQLGAAMEKDFRQGVQWVMRLFEPLVVLGTGTIVGGVVLCMFSAISELTDFQF